MAAIPGLRGTGQFNVDFRPKNYRELYTLLEPNGSAPLNALLAMMDSESTDDPEYKNFRDQLPARTFVVNGAVGDTSTATINIDTGDVGYITTGHVLRNMTTGEVMRATADGNTGTGNITVTRNVGSTSFTVGDDDELVIIGFAATEGATSSTPISFDPSVDYNYTQIFRTPFKVTGTLQNTYRRTGSAEEEFATKALKFHMVEIERAMFFGRRAEVNGTSAQPLRYTGGLFQFITNVTDVSGGSYSGVLTESQFDRLLIENIFAYGSKTKVAFCGPRIASHMQAFGKNRWQPTQVNEGTYGVSFTRYGTFAGDLMLYVHPQFREVPTMDNAMVILDMPYLCYRYMQSRDTTLLRDRQANDEDATLHEYMTECGLELKQDSVHAMITNWANISS